MNDEWRLQIDLRDESHALPLVEHLDARELEHDLSGAFHDLVIVSRDGARLFLYAGSRKQAEAARDLVADLDEKEGWSADVALARWHPETLEWEDPDKPLAEGSAAAPAAHEALVAAERQDSAAGEPEFEVRVDLSSRQEAERFADLLQAEGLPAVRRWKYLVVGAADEDAAKALAARLEVEAPAGSEVAAEGSGQVAWAERPPNPFAVFGGLGG
ncbi:MAG TPA: hypothetical protein VHU86_01285 [Solirubrobacterales bacterium]|nr:hypothetical protein [Solirubrobacterales bacterium]